MPLPIPAGDRAESNLPGADMQPISSSIPKNLEKLHAVFRVSVNAIQSPTVPTEPTVSTQTTPAGSNIKGLAMPASASGEADHLLENSNPSMRQPTTSCPVLKTLESHPPAAKSVKGRFVPQFLHLGERRDDDCEFSIWLSCGTSSQQTPKCSPAAYARDFYLALENRDWSTATVLFKKWEHPVGGVLARVGADGLTLKQGADRYEDHEMVEYLTGLKKNSIEEHYIFWRNILGIKQASATANTSL